MTSNKELITWLKSNSSGSYRLSAEGGERLDLALYLLNQIMQDMPQNRDWLDPNIERATKELLSLNNKNE